MVNSVWCTKIHVFLNFQILKKMQLLKPVLREKFSKTHIEDQLRQVEHHLSVTQNYMHSAPLNPMYANQEQIAVQNLRKVKADFASYISQKAKLNWLKYRDDNTKLFHKSIKNRRNRNTIPTLIIDGITTTEQGKFRKRSSCTSKASCVVSWKTDSESICISLEKVQS